MKKKKKQAGAKNPFKAKNRWTKNKLPKKNFIKKPNPMNLKEP